MAIRIALGAAALALVTGCATIIKGGSQDIAISSSPSGARYEIKDNSNPSATPITGTTPGNVTLKKGAGYFKGASYTLTVSQDGYSPHVVQLNSSASGWYIGGNILVGGLIGWLIIDPVTGAMWTLSPESIQAGLASNGVPEAAPSADPAAAPQTLLDTGMLHVMLKEEVPPHLWGELQQIY
jgi:hypothetical protein